MAEKTERPCGGDKSSQAADIKEANSLLQSMEEKHATENDAV